VVPEGTAFTIHRHATLPFFILETYRAAKPPRSPLTGATPSAGLSLDLPSELASLGPLYEKLRAEGSANAFPRALVNLGRALSSSLNQAVLTLSSDDDTRDFACLCRGGLCERLRLRTEAELVTFEQGALVIDPVTDDGEGSPLHGVAAAEFERFTGQRAAVLGLGTFDPPPRFGLVPDDT
jgi:hypothetical protein